MTIKNERQYLGSLAHRRRLLTAREYHESHPQTDPLAQDWLLAGVDRLLADVDAEIAEYTATAQAGPVTLEIAEVAILPLAFARARVAAGLTQKELAARLGVSEQQVQKDEAGAYARASVPRLTHVAAMLGMRLMLTLRPDDGYDAGTLEADIPGATAIGS
jgi:DNA-binding XRE family transcriptional regulator